MPQKTWFCPGPSLGLYYNLHIPKYYNKSFGNTEETLGQIHHSCSISGSILKEYAPQELTWDMGVEPKIGGFYPPKWMLYNGQVYEQMDDLGGKPLFLGKHPYQTLPFLKGPGISFPRPIILGHRKPASFQGSDFQHKPLGKIHTIVVFLASLGRGFSIPKPSNLGKPCLFYWIIPKPSQNLAILGKCVVFFLTFVY